MIKEFFYDWGGANFWLFHAVNGLRSPILDRFMLLGTQIASHTLFPVYLTLIVLAAVFSATRVKVLDPKQGQDVAFRWLTTLAILCVAYLLDAALIIWAKHFFDFPRPPLILPQSSIHIIGKTEYYRSLPSGHASFSMLIAASLWPVLDTRKRWAAAFFVAWVGVSRINVGAHFPADVLASWLTALPLVLLVRMVVPRCLSGSSETRGENGDDRSV